MKSSHLFATAISLISLLSSATPVFSQARSITDAEKTYVSAAVSYLDTANKQGTNVALAMAGANDGSSTLGDIKAAIKRAKSVENAGYHGDYRSKIDKVAVPSRFLAMQQQLEETHRLFQAAMKEYLEFWKDSNSAHIVSGNATYERCVLIMNKTIEAHSSALKQLKP